MVNFVIILSQFVNWFVNWLSQSNKYFKQSNKYFKQMSLLINFVIIILHFVNRFKCIHWSLLSVWFARFLTIEQTNENHWLILLLFYCTFLIDLNVFIDYYYQFGLLDWKESSKQILFSFHWLLSVWFARLREIEQTNAI